MGLGNSIMIQSFPDTANQYTPWMYPLITRQEHSSKVYADFFGAGKYVMMEDADGYNEIWTVMMLLWPEMVCRPEDLNVPAIVELLSNFRDYVAPNGRIFQYASGLSASYASINWVDWVLLHANSYLCGL